jgi:hypothetical protein
MEYFIFANSFAAPFFSDTSHDFQEAPTPKAALQIFAGRYSHPCGLYAAACYESAEAYHKGTQPLARWLSNHAAKIEHAKPTSILSEGPGKIKLDGKWTTVEDPKGGRVYRATAPGGGQAAEITPPAK